MVRFWGQFSRLWLPSRCRRDNFMTNGSDPFAILYWCMWSDTRLRVLSVSPCIADRRLPNFIHNSSDGSIELLGVW